MQTILGAGGPIATEIAKTLPQYTSQIRLVSRNPEKVNQSDALFPANLLDAAAVSAALEGSSVAYLTAGLQYNAKLWEESWPKIMTNVINACKEHQVKLVFFDNIYMYDPAHLNGMTEKTPINPPSRKGKVRAGIANMLLKEVAQGNLKALIARSADFYGPGDQKNSILFETVIKPLQQGKKATWMGNAKYRHSFTYIPDAGRATAILGNTESAFNQVWHLPTAAAPPTGKEWVAMIAREMKVKPGYMNVPKTMVWLMGLFMPMMKEMPEMMYQNDRDYVFDSGKFESQFDFRPTPYLDGIKETLKPIRATAGI